MMVGRKYSPTTTRSSKIDVMPSPVAAAALDVSPVAKTKARISPGATKTDFRTLIPMLPIGSPPSSSETSSPDLQKEGERGPQIGPESSACATLGDLSMAK